jgi:two-component system NarL family sensor kinase
MHFTKRESASPGLHPGPDESLCERSDLGSRRGLRAVLDALPEEIALLDPTGRIGFVNAAWRRFARESGLGLADAGLGTSYLAACDAAASEVAVAAEAALRIREAIAGRDDEVQLPYVCEWSGGARWFISRVSAFGEGEDRWVVVSHAEVTELKEAEAALHELTARLLVAQDDERRRIARELHDGTAPTMVALSLDLTRLASRLLPGKERDLAEDCAALCEQSLRELRTVSFVLHPPLLERAGLVDALRWLSDGFGKRSGISVALGVEDAPRERLSSDVELSLYRIAQEALTNVQRHSGSRTARVDLAAVGDEVRLTIRDEGVPPRDLLASGGGVGIASMRERVRALGGRLELDCGTSGTVVTAAVPRTPRGAHGSTSRFRIA